MLSQNGWTAVPQYGDPRLVSNPKVPGAGDVVIAGGLNRIAAPVLLWVAAQFHARVEPLKLIPTQQWGFSYRPIRGGTTLSNHSSGTAIDLNSASHPLGAAGTFTPAQVRTIRAILDKCEGLVRWGGDYSGRKDEMHFEVVGTPAQVAQLGARLLSTSLDVPSTPTPTKPPAPATPTPTSPEPTETVEEQDDDMLSTVQVKGEPAIFVAGPGHWHVLTDYEAYQQGVEAGLFREVRLLANQRALDVARSVALQLVPGESGVSVAK